MVATVTTSGAVLLKAGKGTSFDFVSGALIIPGETDPISNVIIPNAEGEVSGIMRRDIVANWANFNTNTKQLVVSAVASIAAVEVIKYDMDVIESLREAENRINILRDTYLRDLSLLRDLKVIKLVEDGQTAG